ncbi:MAG: hypothetical protein ABSC08_01245 [Bryobacteraceae bacterium]|jgi:hypothetical protein
MKPASAALLLALLLLPCAPAQTPADQKAKEDTVRRLTDEEKLTLIRGLAAEYAKVKTFLPRSKKALKFNADGTWDKPGWREAGMEFGPVARLDDLVQVTKVDIEDDQIVLQINGGFKPKGKWYQRVEMGAGVGGAATQPMSRDVTRNYGTTVALQWKGRIPPEITPSEVKKILKPVLDFEQRSASEDYFASLPKEIQEAIKAKRAAVGMSRDQVLMAMGMPRDKLRESRDGLETEDWIYGLPPGRITFVTFANSKVVQVKDAYAGLGGATAPPLKPPQ